jgi:membrane-associated protease RseP (regulator of RpoE activity)
VRGRPLAERFQEYSFRFGFVLVASLMALTLFNDMRDLFF